MFEALYLSPHFDDGVLSCGAQIWDRTQRGEQVAVVTVCAASAPEQLSLFAQSLHLRWSVFGTFDRAVEDNEALQKLGATPIHLDYADCIYRQGTNGDWLYASEEAIFGEVKAEEAYLVEELAKAFATIELTAEAQVFMPRAIGNHIDHQLVRLAGERWGQESGRVIRYYADYPYAETVDGGEMVGVSEEGRRVKIEALLAYRSQLSTFWPNESTLRSKVGGWLERMF
jgi:LmbE family N-acetylglucosaminyl deacetylase